MIVSLSEGSNLLTYRDIPLSYELHQFPHPGKNENTSGAGITYLYVPPAFI